MAKSGISDDRALTMFKESQEWAQSQYSNKQSDWEKQYRETYIFNDKNRTVSTLHDFFVPKIYETIRTIMPKLVGNTPRFIVTPKLGKIDKNKIKSLKEYIEDFEWKRMDMRSKVKELALSMTTYGTAFALVEWREKPVYVWDRKKKQNVEQGRIGMNNVTVLDIHDVLFDYKFVDHQDSPFFMYVKRNLSVQQVEELGFKVEKGETEKKTNSIDNAESAKLDKFRENDWSDPDTNPNGFNHDLWYYYTDNEKGQPVMFAILDGEQVVGNMMNPFPHRKYPVVKVVYEEKAGEGYGVGISEMLMNLQKELNHSRNLRYDNVLRSIVGRWLVDSSRGNIDIKQFLDMSKHVIVGQDVANSIVAIPTPNVTGNAYNETQQLSVDIQTLSGINNFTQSEASGFNDTATGAKMIQANSNLRIDAALDNLETGLAKMGEMIIQNNLAFQENDVIARITDGEDFNLEDFAFPFDLSVESGSTSAQLNFKEQEEAAIFLNSLTPFAQAGLVDMDAILKKFLRSYDIKNVDDFLNVAEDGQPQQEGGAPAEGAPEQIEDESLVTEESIKALTSVMGGGAEARVNAEEGSVQIGDQKFAFETIIETFKMLAGSPQFQQADPQAKQKILVIMGQINDLISGGGSQASAPQPPQQPQQEKLPPQV